MARYETLVEMLEQSIEAHGSNPIFGTKQGGRYEWITYNEFGELVDAARGGLADLGIEREDTVAIIADNSVEWAACCYATFGLSAKFCPMYEDQNPKDWRYILEDSGAKIAVVADQEIYEEVRPWIDEIDTLERVIFLDGPREDDDAWSGVLEAGRAEPVSPNYPDKDDIAGFIYTSGTTGKPKGVLLSHWNLCSDIQATLDVMPIESSDVSLSFLPWAHSFGQTAELHGLISKGASLGLVESVDTILANAAEVRPTILMAVPRIFNKIYDAVHKQIRQGSGLKKKLFSMAMNNSNRLRDQTEDGGNAGAWTRMLDSVFDKLIFSGVREKLGGRLRWAISGGAALSPEVAKFIDNLHIEVYEGYGLTETSPVAACNAPGARKIGSVGRPLPGVDISIRPVEGYDDDIGEICINGPIVMQGYHNLPEQTEQVLDDDGTFHTGDLGRIDDDGFVWILGRVKEQYKLENGKYVVPAPVEEQLKLSPYIDQIMIEGTGCPYNVAVIVADGESLREYAEGEGLEFDSIDDLLDHPRVRELFERELEEWGEEVKSYELPKDFVLTAEEFSTENEMLTPTLKLKRRNIMAAYGDDLSRLYDDSVPIGRNAA